MRIEGFGINLVLADDAKHLNRAATVKKLQSVKEDKVYNCPDKRFACLQAPSFVTRDIVQSLICQE